MAGAEAAGRVQAVLRVAAVEHLLALDPGLQHVRVDAERVAREHHEVGVLALLERADARSRGRACGAPASVSPSIAFSRERPARMARPASRRKKRESTMPSSVWKPNRAPAFSSAAPLPNETSAVSSLPPGGVDHDDRAADHLLAGRDLRRHLPGVADVLQHDPEAELLGEPEGGQDVVVPVGVEVHDALPVEHLAERLHAQVAGRRLLRVGRGLGQLLLVLARLDELLAHQRGGLGAGPGERRRAPRVGPVRHLHAAASRPARW